MKAIFVFVVLFLTAGVSIAREMLIRFGVDTEILLIALVGIVVTGLCVYRKMLFVVLILFLVLTANAPESIIDKMGMDQDVLLVTLIIIAIIPSTAKRRRRKAM